MKNPLSFKALGLLLFGIAVTFNSPAAAAKVDADTFRSLFFGALDKSTSRTDLDYLVYTPATAEVDLRQPPVASNATQFLQGLVAKFGSISPSDLYTQGTKLRTEPSADVESLLRQQPITIVIVPGIFGEFIDTRAFEEILSDGNSAYSLAWKNAIQAHSADKEMSTDQVFSMKAMADQTVPLDSLVHVASLDAQDGTPLVRVVLFYAPRMSLETLGNARDKADLYLRRFSKFMTVMGNKAPANTVSWATHEGRSSRSTCWLWPDNVTNRTQRIIPGWIR